MTSFEHPEIDVRLNNICQTALTMLIGCLVAAADDAPQKPKPVKHQVTGLFLKEREDDLRKLFAEWPEIKLVSVDFKNAEVEFEYDAAKVFPNAAPEQIVSQFDELLKQKSRATFGIKPLRTVLREKLDLIEIPVVGLDCKGCCLAAYEAVYRLEGVEQATASFRDGFVTALIYPDKTDRAKLEGALKQRNVQLAPP